MQWLQILYKQLITNELLIIAGKELRLKQEYFMVAATLVDIIRRFKVNKTSIPESKEELYLDFSEKVII